MGKAVPEILSFAFASVSKYKTSKSERVGSITFNISMSFSADKSNSLKPFKSSSQETRSIGCITTGVEKNKISTSSSPIPPLLSVTSAL